MKQKTKQLGILLHAGIFFIAILILVSGCKNEEDKPATDTIQPIKKEDYSTGDTSKSMELMLPVGSLPFYTLKLEKDSLYKLLNDNEVKKLIVQVVDSNTATTEALGLIAYGVTKKGVRITGPVGFIAVPEAGVRVFPGTIVMGDQDLTLKQIKDILELGNGTIDLTKLRALLFEPARINANKHLFYVVSELGAAGGSGTGTTNPSPPRPPCDTECE